MTTSMRAPSTVRESPGPEVGGRLSWGRVLWLSWHMLRFRWRATVSVLIVGLVATGVVGLAAGVEGAGRVAIVDSVVADRGYATGWVLQGPPGVATPLARVGSAVPVVDGSGSVEVPGRRALARLRVLGNAKAPVGDVVTGRRAQRPREITISRALADALGIHLGATVTVALPPGGRSMDAAVVGLTVNTADRGALEATLLDPGLLGRSPDYWLASGADSDAIGAIQGGVQAASTHTAIVDRLTHLPGPIAALGQLVPALGFVLLVFVVSALAPQLSWARRDVAALCAAGATRRGAWRVIRLAAVLALAVGGALGAGIGTFLLRWLREPLSAHFDQVWLHVPVPVTTPVVMILLLGGGCLLPFGALATLGSWAKVPASVRRSRLAIALMLTLAACGIGALALAVAAIHGHGQVRSPWPMGMFGIIAIVVAARLLVDLVAGTGLRPGTGALVGHLAAQGSLGFVVAAVLATTSAGYVAMTTADANAAMTAGAATQRPGSLLVSGAPARAADAVLALYRQRGGHHWFLYDIPDERTHVVRVTTARAAACLADHDLTACGGPMQVVMLDRHLHGDAARAGRGVTGRTQPWAVTIDPTTSTVTDRRKVPAVVETDLGGNLPGLVVAADGPLARDLRLVPSGTVELGIQDFAALPPGTQAELRSLVQTVAPAAQVSDTTAGAQGPDHERAVADLVALVGSAVAFLILAGASAASMAASRPLRATLWQLGLGRRDRLLLGLRLATSSGTAALAGYRLLSWYSTQFAHAGTGLLWTLPLGTLLALTVVTSMTCLLPPRGTRSTNR